MTDFDRSIERFSLGLILFISILIAVVAPLGYLLISLEYQRGVLDVHSKMYAEVGSGIVRSNPDNWRFESLRLAEILDQTASDRIAETRAIYDSKHELVASNNVNVPLPRLTRSSSLYDAGIDVARIEISRSLRPLLLKSALLAFISLALATAIYLFFRTIPARLIKTAYNTLRESEAEYRTLYESKKEGEERYRALFSQAGEGILIMSQEGNIIDANESFCSMHGYSKQEIMALNISDLDCRGGTREVPDRTHKMLSGKSLTFEVEHSHKDGHIFPLQVSASLITYGGCFYIQSFHHDITERKRAEEEQSRLAAQLQQAQKMESVGRLAGGVAHDFNNLLTVISGYSQLGLMETSPGQSTHEFFQSIMAAANKSADLTRQLLAFARKQTVDPKIIDLNDTVAGMLKMLQRLIGEDIHLIWQPAPNLWPVKVDPSQIDQILANLCVNARDSISDVGTVTIETGNKLIDEAYSRQHAGLLPGEYVQFTVSDNGCGMDKEIQSRIFEPFFTTKDLGKGTGLGLATVYGIVKQNGGFINVYSEPGIGTSFMIYLLRHAGNVLSEVEVPEVSVPRGHETVLLVEDELDILCLGSKLLTSLGYTVLQASTPGEAARLAATHLKEIHLLLTDVVMPEMNGLDLANSLKAINPHLKCIFMSGYTADVIEHHGVLAGSISFIQKPFTLVDLATKVREVLDKPEKAI